MRLSICVFKIQYPAAPVLFNSNFFQLLYKAKCNFLKTEKEITWKPTAPYLHQSLFMLFKRENFIFSHVSFQTSHTSCEFIRGWVENNEKVRKQRNSNNKHTPQTQTHKHTQNHAAYKNENSLVKILLHRGHSHG